MEGQRKPVHKVGQDIKNIWSGDCYIHGFKTNARGVAILFQNNFEYEVLSTQKDTDGNDLSLILKISSVTINIITIYAPNRDSPLFFSKLQDLLQDNDADYCVICGDFNLVLNPVMDTYGYKHINNNKARLATLKIMEDFGLVDIYRHQHPSACCLIWRKRNPVKQARLDFYLISETLADIIDNCEIKPGYRSGHSCIELTITLNNFKIWKFNNSLLKNQDYLNLINKVIKEEVIKCGLPVCNLEYLNENYREVNFTIGSDLFLEVLLLRICGESIKFSTFIKKKNNSKEMELIKDTEYLEQHNDVTTSHGDLLQSLNI